MKKNLNEYFDNPQKQLIEIINNDFAFFFGKYKLYSSDTSYKIFKKTTYAILRYTLLLVYMGRVSAFVLVIVSLFQSTFIGVITYSLLGIVLNFLWIRYKSIKNFLDVAISVCSNSIILFFILGYLNIVTLNSNIIFGIEMFPKAILSIYILFLPALLGILIALNSLIYLAKHKPKLAFQLYYPITLGAFFSLIYLIIPLGNLLFNKYTDTSILGHIALIITISVGILNNILIKPQNYIINMIFNKFQPKQEKELINLLNNWDPIGVYPFKGGPKDEYEDFVNPIVSVLQKGTNKKELTIFLKQFLKEHVGLTTKVENIERFSDATLKWWWANNWPFDQPRNAIALTTNNILENHYPILSVVHYKDDDSWGFYCGTTNKVKAGKVISMQEAVNLDPTLYELAKQLLPGHKAWRKDIYSKWIIK